MVAHVDHTVFPNTAIELLHRDISLRSSILAFQFSTPHHPLDFFTLYFLILSSVHSYSNAYTSPGTVRHLITLETKVSS